VAASLSEPGANSKRDASISSTLTTSPYDVSRGGFSGANFNIRTGNFYNTANQSLLLSGPLSGTRMMRLSPVVMYRLPALSTDTALAAIVE